jgi:hypothetical protein
MLVYERREIIFWIYEIKLNEQYQNFGRLIKYLLDCLLDKVNNNNRFFDFTNQQLQNKIAKK